MNFLNNLKLKSLKKRIKVLYDKNERGENIDVKHEIKAHLELARFYDKHQFDKQLPRAEILALESYRAAALLGSAEAQYIFGKRQLETAKFWDQWSQSMYGRDIHKTYAKNHNDEAFNYLEKAQANGYPLAKRLLGLSYIHGWGVPKDKDKGFKLVVDSIGDENAWDRATQIFNDLGLNTPEFFSSIMALKDKRA